MLFEIGHNKQTICDYKIKINIATYTYIASMTQNK